MIGYIVWTDLGIGMYGSREEALAAASEGDRVVEVNAAPHVYSLDRPVFFTQKDQSYPKLYAELLKRS